MKKELESFFGEIIDANRGSIYRICKVYAVKSDDEDDLFQEVLLNIWKSLPGFRKEAELNTWVYRITLNVCLRWKLKAAARPPVVPIDKVKPERLSDHTMAEMEKKEKHEMLYACISKLNDTDKSLITLYLEDLSYKSISEITGLSENHIAVKLGRVRKQLFTCLTPNK